MSSNLPVSQIELEIERIQQKYPHLRRYQEESQLALSNYLACDKSTELGYLKSTELTPDKHQKSFRRAQPLQDLTADESIIKTNQSLNASLEPLKSVTGAMTAL